MRGQRSCSTLGFSATSELCTCRFFGDFLQPTILLPLASSDSLEEYPRSSRAKR